MIKRSTVFVIGAGAHCPYGLPDGSTLTRKIVEMLPDNPNPNANNEFHDMFIDQYSREVTNIRQTMFEFRRRLDNAGQLSIDGFLQTYANCVGYPEIGKFAVAKYLLPLEFKTAFSRSANLQQDWLSFLFTFMQKSCSTADEFIERNTARFVTFNYDRTLEYFLFHRLVNTFGLTDDQAFEKLKQIPLVHVYGSLGEFRPDFLGAKGYHLFYPRQTVRTPNFTPSEIRAACSSIRLMYDDRHEQTEVEQAKQLISDSEVICFLGFSFDPDNVARLELAKLCQPRTKDVWACRYQMPEGEWGRAIQNMAPAIKHVDIKREWDALTFLHETRALG